MNTSFTRPLSGANHIVRVPLPNLKPGWVNVLVTTSAWYVPFGTVTFCTPTTRDVNDWEVFASETLRLRAPAAWLSRTDLHWSPGRE